MLTIAPNPRAAIRRSSVLPGKKRAAQIDRDHPVERLGRVSGQRREVAAAHTRAVHTEVEAAGVAGCDLHRALDGVLVRDISDGVQGPAAGGLDLLDGLDQRSFRAAGHGDRAAFGGQGGRGDGRCRCHRR
jgi:hypothetical protein